jgi:hypothetical protein
VSMPARGPYSAAIARGECPLCLGSGKLGDLAMCLHGPPRHQAGDPCELCLGSGKWPPPDPDAVAEALEAAAERHRGEAEGGPHNAARYPDGAPVRCPVCDRSLARCRGHPERA